MAKKTAKKPKGSKPPPICKAILLCDQAIIEQGTSKASLVGIFDTFNLSEIPGSTKPCFLFVQLIEGIGNYKVSIEIRSLDNGDSLVARSGVLELAWPERQLRVNLALPVPPLPVERAGEFDLIVTANGQAIGNQKFSVQG